jgi:hypothetical protein
MKPAPFREGLFNSPDSVIKGNFWNQWFNELVDILNQLILNSPKISTGTAAPISIPAKTGDIYCDTANAKVYIATGISASSDWKVLN